MNFRFIVCLLSFVFVVPGNVPAQEDIYKKITIPQIDLAGEKQRQVVVDQKDGQYLGHVTTVLMDDGKTILAVYPIGHAAGQILYKKSTDGGLTWSERLPTPENWSTGKDVPCLMRLYDQAGKHRLFLFSGRLSNLQMYGRFALSEDEGANWSPLQVIGYWGDTCIADAMPIDIPAAGAGFASPTGFDCQMVPDNLRGRSGKYITLFGNFGAAKGKPCYIWSSVTEDGGLSWSYPKVVWEGKDMNPTETGMVRSPDGKQIAAIWRDTRAEHNSQIIFSDDEGKTWTKPRPVPLAQCGERHTIRYLKDGRLFMSFRCRHHLSNTTPWNGDWGAWIGTYDDLAKGIEGQYRIRLMDNLDGGDCAYPGVVVLPDGTVVSTTYGTWEKDKQKYIVSVRLKPEEIDEKAKSASTPKNPAVDKAILDMALETPKLLVNPGPEYDDEHRDYNMTIGIERTPKGRLWAAWVSGGDSDKGFFVLASSDDEGKTWSKPRLAIDPTNAPNGLRRRILVGNLWTDPKGRLWLFFDQSMGYYDGRAGDWATVCDNPDADNPTWSTPVRVWHGATLGKPTVLSSGEWMLPISLWERGMINPKNMLGDAHPELDDLRGANVFVSSDEGKTWNRQGRCRFPHHSFDEHMIVERKDASLWMLARTGKSRIMQSFSTDKGKTWSTPEDAFPHVVSRFFIRRLASGNILFVRHGKMDEVTNGRTRLTAFLSDDDGKTWKGGLVLDERNGISYPDGFQFPDGRIGVSYDRNRGGDAEVLMSIFTEEDVLASTPVSGKTVFKQIVSKALGGKKK